MPTGFKKQKKTLSQYFNDKKTEIPLPNGDEQWTILSPIEQFIKSKIEAKGTPLKDWDIKINYGIKTGYNEAFIIDTKTRDIILKNCKGDERKKTEQLIRPILRGRDIKKYKAEWADLWLIGTFPTLNIDIDDYPAVKNHLEKYMPKLNQTGETYIDENGETQKTRKKNTNKWFETQDSINYWNEFSKPKIVWAETSKENKFTWDESQKYIDKTTFAIFGAEKNILSFLNSKIMEWYFKKILGSTLGKEGASWSKQHVELIPIPNIENNISKFIDKVIENKSNNKETSNIEKQIERVFHEYYGFTANEIKTIEKL